MEVNKIDVQKENKLIIQKAVENGKPQTKTKNLFNALKDGNIDPIREYDFSAFKMFRDKNGDLCLTDDDLKALKLFDINNDGTFQHNEYKLLDITYKIGGSQLILNSKIVDFDKNGILNKYELSMLSKLLNNNTGIKNKKAKVFLAKDSHGHTALMRANEKETQKILDKMGDDKELLKEVLLAKLDGFESIHLEYIAGGLGPSKDESKKLKLILNKIGDDKELLEEVLMAKGVADYTLLHSVVHSKERKSIEIILDKIGDNEELLTKVLLAKNCRGNTPLHEALQYDNTISDYASPILRKIANNHELLEKILLAKNDRGNIPLHEAGSKMTEVIFRGYNRELLEKILSTKNNLGHTPLEEADAKKTEIILDAEGHYNYYLLQKFISAKNEQGRTILHEADSAKTKVILQKILDLYKINNCDPEIRTELKNLYRSMAKKLLYKGDNKGNTAYDLANEDKKKVIEFYMKEFEK